jgi:hypothetical protein
MALSAHPFQFQIVKIAQRLRRSLRRAVAWF